MKMSIPPPSLLFPAISLLLLATRFAMLTNAVCKLNDMENVSSEDVAQIDN